MHDVDSEMVADVMGWEGDPDTLVNALVTSGFLDQIDGVLYIHDWEEYSGKLAEQRKANAARQQAWRDRNKGKTPPPDDDNHSVTVTSPLRNALENSTGQDRREQTTCAAPADVSLLAAIPANAVTPPKQTSSKPTDPPKTKPVNPFWDALVTGIGHNPTPSKKGAWGKAIHDLKEMDATPEAIIQRCEIHRAKWPEMTLTATSLAANWYDLDPETTARASPAPPIQLPSLAGGFKRPEKEKAAS